MGERSGPPTMQPTREWVIPAADPKQYDMPPSFTDPKGLQLKLLIDTLSLENE